MRTRHKSPTLVSMWMLDVFCCALGCAVLLWTLESLRASLMTEEAAAAQVEFEQSRQELLALQAESEKTKRDLLRTIDDLQSQLARTLALNQDQEKKVLAIKSDLTITQRNLAQALKDLAQATRDLNFRTAELQQAQDRVTRSTTLVTSLEEEMKKKQQSLDEMTLKMATVKTSEAELQRLLRLRLAENEQLLAKSRQTQAKLDDLDAKYQALMKDNTDLSIARANARDIKNQLDQAKLTIIDLQGDRKKLADKIDKLTRESDSRFAGVAMTGKRVAFVVDVSGSMKLLDEKTPDPNKWTTVVETITKVMRSIPDLEKYQVITFSRNAKYLFGSADWRDYRGEESIKQVQDGLMNTIVAGDTNMYDGFDLAFRLRDSGLDTIYFFSDGLPTSGAGLTPEQDLRLTEIQRTEVLARHIRTTIRTTWNRPLDNKRVKVNSIGFFFESPEVGAFLWALSRENDGSFVGMSKP